MIVRVACVSVLMIANAYGDDPSDSLASSELRALVVQLGAKQFVVRESATMRLYELGQGGNSEQVMRLLSDATKTGDREVRTRARRVLSQLAERLQAEKVARFLKGLPVSGVPGWQRFSDTYGDSEITRAMYGDLLKEEWDLLAACFPQEAQVGATTIRNLTNVRFATLLRRENGYQQLPIGTILTYLHIGAEYPDAVSLQGQLFHVIRSSIPLAQRIRSSTNDPASANGLTRKIVSRWLMETVKQNGMHEMSAIVVTSQARMFEEAKQIAEHVLKRKASLPVNKKTAMQIFAALRDKRGIPLIEPYLKDESQLRRQSKRLQLRDVALTCLMDLHGHDVAKIKVKRINNLLNPYEYSTLGFDTPEEREEAFALFEELQAEKKFQQQKKQAAEENQDPDTEER